MNALEANMLDRSMGRLGDTLLQNRVMADQQKERELQRAMRGEAINLQREDMQQRRDYQDRVLRQQGEATRSLDEYRKAMTEAKTEQEKLGLWSDMLKAGVLGPESLDAMSKAMSEKLGVQVILKMPETVGDPKVWEDAPSGRRYAYRPGSKELHDLTPNVGESVEEVDPLTGQVTQKIRRKLTPADLKAAMPTFADEGEARAAGYKAGDIVRLRLNGKPTRVRLK